MRIVVNGVMIRSRTSGTTFLSVFSVFADDIRNNKSWKHRALITYNIPLKTKRMESDCLNRALNHIIRVRKKRVHQHETKDDADDGGYHQTVSCPTMQ